MFDAFKNELIQVARKINVRVGGKGPAVLLLHGYPQNMHEWAFVAPLLARNYTVVCTDLRGYGDSEKPQSDGHTYSFDALADDQIKVMDALGMEHFSVIGHDRGARVALKIAEKQRRRVDCLGLLDIVPTEQVLTDITANVAKDFWHWFLFQQPAPYPEQLIAAAGEEFFLGFFKSLGGFDARNLHNEQFASYRANWRSEDFIRATCEEYRTNARIALAAVPIGKPLQCPTLVAWGRRGVLPANFDVRLCWEARLARPTFVEMPGGHFFVDEFPNETATVIENFLSHFGAT